MGGGFAGITPTLDQVLVRSLNNTIEHMIISGPDHLTKFEVRDNLGNPIFTVDTVTPAVTIVGGSGWISPVNIFDPTQTEFAIVDRTLSGLDIDSGVGSSTLSLTVAGTVVMFLLGGSYVRFDDDLRPLTAGVQACGTTLFPWGDVRTLSVTIDDPTQAESGAISRSLDYLILDAGAGALGVLIEDGQINFTATGQGYLREISSTIEMGYGTLGGYKLCITSTGELQTILEAHSFIEAGFLPPTTQFFNVVGNARTSGDVLSAVGDVAILTTGRLFSLFNDGAGGPGGSPVFTIDKNGKVAIFDSTGAEFGSIERTLTDLIINTEAGGGLSIQIASVEVIGDNGVSALVLGNTTLAPQLPVLTTAQRNALTATSGMIIFNTTDDKFQGYNNTTWTDL